MNIAYNNNEKLYLIYIKFARYIIIFNGKYRREIIQNEGKNREFWNLSETNLDQVPI